MRDHDRDQLQPDLDMEMETAKMLRRRLEDARDRKRLRPHRPTVERSPFAKLFNTVMFILVLLVFLYKLEMLIRGL